MCLLPDNAYDPDVNAKQFWIDKTVIKNENCLTFMDNGNGMDYETMHKMLRYLHHHIIDSAVIDMFTTEFYFSPPALASLTKWPRVARHPLACMATVSSLDRCVLAKTLLSSPSPRVFAALGCFHRRTCRRFRPSKFLYLLSVLKKVDLINISFTHSETAQ